MVSGISPRELGDWGELGDARSSRRESAGRRPAAGFCPSQRVFEAIERALAPPLRDWRAGVDARQRDLIEIALAERITPLVELEAARVLYRAVQARTSSHTISRCQEIMMHSSHTGWSSPTGSHSMIRRCAQRSAGRQPLHTTQSFSGIGMTAACSPKVAHERPKEGLWMKGVRSMLDRRPTLNRRLSVPSRIL
jgi:hypothetical protein